MTKLGIRTILACLGVAAALTAMPASAQVLQRPTGVTPVTPALADITTQSRAEIARRVAGPNAAIRGTAWVTPMAPTFNNGQLVMTGSVIGGQMSWGREEIWFSENAWIVLDFRAAASTRYLIICDLSREVVTWSARIAAANGSLSGAGTQDLPVVWEAGKGVIMVPAGAARSVTVGLTSTRPAPHATRSRLRRCEVSTLG